MSNRTGSKKTKVSLAVVLMALFTLLVAACGGGSTPAPTQAPAATPTQPAGGTQPTPTAGQQEIAVCPQMGVREMTGAGATFPFPLLSVMLDDYFTQCRVRANYQSIGSGGGIRQVQEQTVDWGASEAIMNASQQSGARGGNVLHIPFVAGAVAPVYNLPGIPTNTLRITPDVLADIYLKKITRWNDARLTGLNPGVNLPNTEITVVHRSDGSGTTFVWTHYLSQISEEWASAIGYATSVAWPGDIGGPGNEGVSNQVRQIPGAIDYVERAYALQNNIPWIQVQNSSGNYIAPTREAAALAADVADLPDDMQVMVTNTSNPDGYPITGFAWMLVYENQQNEAMADAVARLAYWMLNDGQKHTAPLEYVSIEGAAHEKAINLIRQIKYNGQPVLR
jgi:phosphate transport system substrate-binding protein